MKDSTENATRPRHPVRHALRRAFGLATALAVFSLFYAVAFGLPGWLRDEALRIVSRGDFAIFASSVRLDPVRGIAMKDIRIYRKGIVGAATLEAADVVATVGIPELVSGVSRLRKLVVRNGVFRPAMLHRRGLDSAEGTNIPLDVQVELVDFVVQDVAVEHVSFRLVSQDGVARYQGITGRVATGPMAGPITGECGFDVNTAILTGHLITEFDPYALMPVFDAWDMHTARWIIESFDFDRRKPRCEATFERACTEAGNLKFDGRFWTENSTYNGVEMLRADGTVTAELTETNSWVTVDPVLVVRQEGIAKGSFTVRPERGTIEFEGVSTLDPTAVSRLVGVLTNGIMERFNFRGPIKIDGKGLATYGIEPPGHDFVMNVDGRGVGIGPVVVDRYSFAVKTSGNSNHFTNIRGRFYGGSFEGAADVVVPEGPATSFWYRAEAKATGIDFGRFAGTLLRDEERDYSGELSVTGQIIGFSGAGKSRTVRGDGALHVRRGRVFMLPVFGGLSTLMVKIIPGLDFVLRQSDADADFAIEDGRVHSRKVDIEGDILSLQGHGDCGFDGSLDYEAQIKLMKEHTLVGKLLRGITWPLTKLLEFRLRGTPSDPRWYPVNFSTDLLEKLGLKKGDTAERGAAVPE